MRRRGRGGSEEEGERVSKEEGERGSEEGGVRRRGSEEEGE